MMTQQEYQNNYNNKTDQGRWVLDVPGPGAKPCFMLDPQIIPQKWGANLWTHSTDVQSALLGIDKRVNRDCLDTVQYKRQSVYTEPIQYPVCDTFLTTDQSRGYYASMDCKRFATKSCIYIT